MLVGRDAERARLEALLERARGGAGGLVLLSGEAGVGKTCLAAEVAAAAPVPVLRGAPVHGSPYGPLVAALRSRLRAEPTALAHCGPLRDSLALLLPELGDPAPAADRATLFEALRCAFAALGPALVILDDLQWSDEATLDVLAALAEPLATLPLLVVAAYRSDGLPRHHGIRRLRHDLRRAGRLEEVALCPFDREGTAALLARALGAPPSPALVRAVHDRTDGLPFFVEELAAAGALAAGTPLPDTVRDAVLVGVADLSAEARAAAEVAAVAGERFNLELVAELASEAGVAELLDAGLIREPGAFRHALAREALYADVPWMRRRALHRALAERLPGAESRELARHWLGARDLERARLAFVRSAAEAEAVHAYRDAAEAGRQALDLWPEGEDDARAEALERYARCSELAGDLAEAARALRELVTLEPTPDRRRALAEVQDLRGDREAAFAARAAAAAGFAADGRLAEAAVEHLAMANQRRLAAHHGEARALARTAREQAEAAGRLDLRIRALGLEGMAAAKHGDYEGGLATVRGGLALALEHDLTGVAAELYQRLSVTLYDSADYPRAAEALDTALDLCRAAGDAGTELACVTCMAYVLRERGDWARAAELCRDLIAAGRAVFVAEALLGSIYAYEGRLGSARRLLASGLATASRTRHYNMTVDATASLARVAAAAGAHDDARERCRDLLASWETTDDHHYAVGGIRWAAGYLAAAGDRAGAHACAAALTRIASESGHGDALAALAHAIAEAALLEGDAAAAAEQLDRAVELHRGLDLPFERAQIELRASVALAAAGERERALERLRDAYGAARRLGARPLAAEAASQAAALGASLGDNGGLSAREREVVRRLAGGQTNREIAADLYLSPRTVDMHVRNILRKLDCRSRVEAAGRARELGLTA